MLSFGVLGCRMLRAWVDRFITPSSVLGNWMASSLPTDRVTTVPNFVHPPEGPSGTQGERTGLLFVGRLSKEKGVDQLIKALPLIRERVPGAGLTVVGDGPARALLEHLARQQASEPSITTSPILVLLSSSARIWTMMSSVHVQHSQTSIPSL